MGSLHAEGDLVCPQRVDQNTSEVETLGRVLGRGPVISLSQGGIAYDQAYSTNNAI